MIPNPTQPCWQKLASGKTPLKTDNLGLQMLLKRLQGKLGATPPDGELRSAAAELHAFFVKYEKILANEIKAL